MKPCSSNRKRLAWLVLGISDAEQARRLRAHLDTCPGCRSYLDELSAVKTNLAAVEIAPALEASSSFRRRWTGAIQSVRRGTVWEAAVGLRQRHGLGWRVALPALGATVLVVLTLPLFTRRPEKPPTAQPATQAAVPGALSGDLPPTVANYQMAANQSFEALDELLTRQGNRNLPRAPVYTASTFAVARAAE
jgi:hypothetical protein